MITITYAPDIKELTKVTLDFIEKRPMLRIGLWLLHIISILLCIAFISKAITNTATISDTFFVLCALIWLFFRRKINECFLRYALKKAGIAKNDITYHASKLKISCNQHLHKTKQLSWHSVKKIYQHKLGYVIPLSGITRGGKFFWLPCRGFASKEDEQDFLQLLAKQKLKIKKL